MSRKINITNDIDFVGLDDVIERLTALRMKYGPNAVVDITMERENYADSDHVEVTLIVED